MSDSPIHITVYLPRNPSRLAISPASGFVRDAEFEGKSANLRKMFFELARIISVFIITLSLSSCETSKQNLSSLNSAIDSLKKYSYHVFGFYIRQPMQLDSAGNVLGGETGGTCFFIRKNGELFLITAKHVLTGCDSLEKVKNFPSSLMIWVSPNSSFRIAQFDVSIIRDTASCLPIPLSPDEIVIRIKDSSAKDVYSIEKFLSAPFKKVRNSLFIGYPAATSTLAGRIKRVEPSTIGLVNKEYYFSQGYTDSTRKNLDIINHRIYSDSIDFEQNFHGYSGSPLFVQDLKTKKWRIAGVLAGTGRDNFNKYYFYAVRIEYPLSDIGITY